MDTIQRTLEAARQGFTDEQIEAAWKLIKPEGNWKDPIHAVIPEEEFKVCGVACSWYTATPLYVVERFNDGRLLVGAGGYYAGPAADG